jgi:hypothetical protein
MFEELLIRLAEGLDPEDVVIHKIVAGRHRDLEGVRTILIKNPQIDTEYIRNWLMQLSAALESTDLLTTFSDLGHEFSEGGSK